MKLPSAAETYGEPWSQPGVDGDQIRESTGLVRPLSGRWYDRALACVNALAGIDHPLAFRQDLQEVVVALKAAEKECDQNRDLSDSHIAAHCPQLIPQRHALYLIRASLAKLKPFD